MGGKHTVSLVLQEKTVLRAVTFSGFVVARGILFISSFIGG